MALLYSKLNLSYLYSQIPTYSQNFDEHSNLRCLLNIIKIQKDKQNIDALLALIDNGLYGAVADAVAEAPPADELTPSSSNASPEEEEDDNCPRISPFGCCLV